mgnify:CR=1 FL=1
MNVNIHDSPNIDPTLRPRRRLDSDVASHDKSTMNVSINCSPLTILPSAKRTLTDDIPEGDNETRWIPWDYIPRDKITTEHVVGILGKKRLKQSKSMITLMNGSKLLRNHMPRKKGISRKQELLLMIVSSTIMLKRIHLLYRLNKQTNQYFKIFFFFCFLSCKANICISELHFMHI